MGIPNDPALRAALSNLADAILPIAEWVAGRTDAPRPRLPWRRGGGPALSITTLAALDVVSQLIDDDDPKLDARWTAADIDPFALYETAAGSVDAKQRWIDADRAKDFVPHGRTDDPTPLFRVDEKSWPAPIDPSALAPDRALPIPATRGGLYGACWAPFMAAVATLGSKPDWAALASALLTDGMWAWSKSAPKSSRFLRTFTRDLLIATMGMRSAKADDYTNGLLVELREERRTANRYSREDVEAAREAFEAKLRSTLTSKTRA